MQEFKDLIHLDEGEPEPEGAPEAPSEPEASPEGGGETPEEPSEPAPEEGSEE